jgi:hypothetical protein
MRYQKILAEKLDMPKIFVNTKEELEELTSEKTILRFQMDVANEEEQTGTAYIAIADGIAYLFYPDWYFDEENEKEESPEEYFERRNKNFAEIDAMARTIGKLPEWSKCKNKSQRALVIDKYMVSIRNKDFQGYDIEKIADYIKVYIEGGVNSDD